MKKIIYSLVIMIAAGSLFTSCVNYDEPTGVQDLREAKASYLDALSGLRAADAALQNAYAEVEKANAAYRNAEAALMQAKADYQKLLNEGKEIENSEALAAAEKAIADYKAAQEEAALKHETEMAKLQQAFDDLQKKIAAEALTLTADEEAVLKKIIENYDEAYQEYLEAANKVATAEVALYNAKNEIDNENYYDEWTVERTAEFYKSEIASYQQAIENAEANKEAFNARPDIQTWKENLATLKDEIDQSKYQINKNIADTTILIAKDLTDGVKAAQAAMSQWISENWVDPFEPQVLTLEINIPTTLQALVPSVMAYFAGENPSGNLPGQSAFIITMAKYIAELLLNEDAIKYICNQINIITTDSESVAPTDYLSLLATAYNRYGLLFDFEVSPDFSKIIVSGTAERFEGFVNGKDMMTAQNLLSGWDINFNLNKTDALSVDYLSYLYQFAGPAVYAAYSAITVKNLGLKGILDVIEDNDLLANADDTTANNAYKKQYEAAKANYDNDLATLEAGFENYMLAYKPYTTAEATYKADTAALAVAKKALDSTIAADKAKGNAMFEAFKTMKESAEKIKVQGTADAVTYSEADALDLLNDVQAFVAARQALVGVSSNDSISYLKPSFTGLNVSSVEIASTAIADLTLHDLKQNVSQVAVWDNKIHYKVNNNYTVQEEPILGGVKYTMYDYEVKYTTYFDNDEIIDWKPIDEITAIAYHQLYQALTDHPEYLQVAALSEPKDDSAIDDPISRVFKAIGSKDPFWSDGVDYGTFFFPVPVGTGYAQGAVDQVNDYHVSYVVSGVWKNWESAAKIAAYNKVYNPINGKPVGLIAKVSSDSAALNKAFCDGANAFNNVYEKFFGLNSGYLDIDNVADIYAGNGDLTVAQFKAEFKNQEDTLAMKLHDMKYFAENADKFLDYDILTGVAEPRVALDVAVAMGNFQYIKPNYIYDAAKVLAFVCGNLDDSSSLKFHFTEFIQMYAAKQLYSLISNGKTTQELFDLFRTVSDEILSQTKALEEANAAAEEEMCDFLAELCGPYWQTDPWGWNSYYYPGQVQTINDLPYTFSVETILNKPAPMGGIALDIYNQYLAETVNAIWTLAAKNEALEELVAVNEKLYNAINDAYGAALEHQDDVTFTDYCKDLIAEYDAYIEYCEHAIEGYQFYLARIEAGVDDQTIAIEKAERELAYAQAWLAEAEELLAQRKAEYEAAMAKFFSK